MNSPKTILEQQAEHFSSLATGQLLGTATVEHFSNDKVPVEVEELLDESRAYFATKLIIVVPALSHYQLPFVTVWHTLEANYPLAAYRTFQIPAAKKRKKRSRPLNAWEVMGAAGKISGILGMSSLLDNPEVEEFNRTRQEIEAKNRHASVCKTETEFIEWLREVFTSAESQAFISRLLSLTA